jgi:hypothetical protein
MSSADCLSSFLNALRFESRVQYSSTTQASSTSTSSISLLSQALNCRQNWVINGVRTGKSEPVVSELLASQ